MIARIYKVFCLTGKESNFAWIKLISKWISCDVAVSNLKNLALNNNWMCLDGITKFKHCFVWLHGFFINKVEES